MAMVPHVPQVQAAQARVGLVAEVLLAAVAPASVVVQAAPAEAVLASVAARVVPAAVDSGGVVPASAVVLEHRQVAAQLGAVAVVWAHPAQAAQDFFPERVELRRRSPSKAIRYRCSSRTIRSSTC